MRIISDLTFGSTSPAPCDRQSLPAELAWQEFSGGVQHQLAPRVGVNVGYFRRTYSNFTVTDNRAVGPADYTTFGFTAPVDPRLPGGGGYPVSGYYNLNPNKVGQVDNFVTAASDFGSQIEHWNGVDVGMNLRLPGVRAQGGLSTGRTSTDRCAIAQQLIEILGTQSINQCHVDTNLLTQVKFLATSTIPTSGHWGAAEQRGRADHCGVRRRQRARAAVTHSAVRSPAGLRIRQWRSSIRRSTAIG